MLSHFEPRLAAFAEVIVRVGLNLQPGQRLLIAEPYELQGVARSAAALVEAVRKTAAPDVEVIWGDGAQLRQFALNKDWRGFVQLVGVNARRMQEYISNRDALLFLQGSQPRLLDGVPAGNLAELRRIGWEHFGPIAQQLVQGATNWTVAPAPAPAWAHAAYADLPSDQRLAALWDEVFEALKIPRRSATSGRAVADPPGALAKPKQPALALATAGGRVPPEDSPITAWQQHLTALRQQCDSLNAQRPRTLRYVGDGTDLTIALPPGHLWCTAQLATKSGLSFVANLPTEEVFTAPHRDSAEGIVTVSRPVSYGGAVIEGIELEFKRGRVVTASARTGASLLARLLETDDGAGRLGEVAVVGHVGGSSSPDLGLPGHKAPPANWQNSGRLFFHPLLDENAQSHIALGEAYGFCQRPPDPAALNRSLVHVDLPLAAKALLPGAEPG